MGLHTGLDTGSLLDLFRLSTIVRNLVSGFDNGLIAAPSKGQINGILGPSKGLAVGNGIHSHTDAHGHRHFITDVDLPDFIQNRKAAGLNRRHVLMIDHKNIPILLHLGYNGIIGLHIFCNFSFNQRCQQ